MNQIATGIQGIMLDILDLFGVHATEFRNGIFLWGLLLLPAFWIWYAWYYHPRRLMVRLSYDPEKVVKGSGLVNAMRFVPPLLQSLAWVLLVIALARPQSANEFRDRKSNGIDIMLLIDVSASMSETRDMEGRDRLTVAKEIASKFIKGRQSDRIGIVLFAAGAYSYAPLTLDYELLQKLIHPISSTMMTKSGTALGTAVGVGIHRLEKSKTPSKVMILITDGASNYGELPPITTAQLAADQNIKIYTIAVGKPEFNGQVNDFDEPTLQQMASITGGKFFRSADENSFENAMHTISEMEKAEFTEEVIREVTDVYPPVVLTGLLLLVLSFAFTVTLFHNPFEG